MFEFLKKRKLENKYFFLLFAILLLVLVFNRAIPFIKSGPFGFGYDLGIYKKTFEDMLSFKDVISSSIDLFPSFLAYISNLAGLSSSFLLYYFYIFLSVLVAIPLYLLTKEYFGRESGLIAVAIYTLSYIQVLAGQFYLYKALLGAVFLLSALLMYKRKSYWFYLFAFLLAMTQLPQFLILAIAVGFSAVFGFRKNLRFNLIGLGVMGFAVVFLLLLRPELLGNAVEVVIQNLKGMDFYDSHYRGFFINVSQYFIKGIFVLLLGIVGLVLGFRKKGIAPLVISVVFLLWIVVFKMFFENRFTVELDLLLIPFAAYTIYKASEKIIKTRFAKICGAVILIFVTALFSIYYYQIATADLSQDEIWGINFVENQQESDYVLVTHSFFAPWLYGFSGKNVLAPGIFESVWNFDEYMEYVNSPYDKKAEKLGKIAKKYGKFYMYEGRFGRSRGIHLESDKIDLKYSLKNTRVYLINP